MNTLVEEQLSAHDGFDCKAMIHVTLHGNFGSRTIWSAHDGFACRVMTHGCTEHGVWNLRAMFFACMHAYVGLPPSLPATLPKNTLRSFALLAFPPFPPTAKLQTSINTFVGWIIILNCRCCRMVWNLERCTSKNAFELQRLCWSTTFPSQTILNAYYGSVSAANDSTRILWERFRRKRLSMAWKRFRRKRLLFHGMEAFPPETAFNGMEAFPPETA